MGQQIGQHCFVSAQWKAGTVQVVRLVLRRALYKDVNPSLPFHCNLGLGKSKGQSGGLLPGLGKTGIVKTLNPGDNSQCYE